MSGAGVAPSVLVIPSVRLAFPRYLRRRKAGKPFGMVRVGRQHAAGLQTGDHSKHGHRR